MKMSFDQGEEPMLHMPAHIGPVEKFGKKGERGTMHVHYEVDGADEAGHTLRVKHVEPVESKSKSLGDEFHKFSEESPRHEKTESSKKEKSEGGMTDKGGY